MTTNGHDIDLPKSTKNLFTLLSGSLNLKSHQFIATELERNIQQLTSGILYFKSHNPAEDSLTELKKKKSSEALPVEVLAKTSVFLDLSADQCTDLFHSYLMNEFRGTTETVKTLFTNDIKVKQLLTELNEYYYSERLFGLFCMKQILCHWNQCSDHVYQKIFHSFLERINGNNELLPKLISQLVALNNSPVPSRLTNGPYFNETLAKEWFVNNLKEQTEVLELLLLYLKAFETSIDTIIELLNIFRSNGFGLKFTQFHRNDCDFISEEVFKFIGFLQSLIIVEMVDIKWLYECQQQDIECQLFKPENAKQFKELDNIITNLSGGVVEHSPIFMTWLIVRSWEIPDFDSNASASVVSQLGSNAVHLNVFNYLEKCLHLPQTTALSGTMVSDLIHRSIADILFVTFNVFNIEMLGNSMTALNQLCIELFKNDFTAKDLFKNGLDSGLGLIISTGLANFPFKVNPILSFCLSLSKTENCKQLFEKLSILSNLTSYTEPFDSSLTNYMPSEEESTYVLIRDKMLFRDTDLLIKKGTKGLLKIVSNNRVIEWTDINIDGWKLIYHRFKEKCDLVSRGQLYSVPEIGLIEMSEITEICSNLIKHNCYQHISSFNRIIALSFETFELFASVEHPFRLFMASVLELSASVVALDLLDATTVWSRITGRRFMPYMIGLSSDLNEIMSGNDTNTSVLGQIITSDECLKGMYELCISFLKLIESVVQKQELKENSDLMAALIFIIQEVFPSHFFWNFKDQNQFHKIGRLCFDIFYHILSKTEKSNPTKTEQIVINSLMEGKAAQTLLRVIKSGEINVRNVILSAGNDNSLTNDDQITIVRQSLSTLNRLLVLHNQTNSSEPTGVVATALFSSQSKPNMLLIVSHYVYQRYDTHLATLAVQLLTELAKRFPMSMLACLGSEAETMREHFLYRLEEVTEDLNLKIALLNFLSACAERQPGLMEMFLNVDNQNNENTTGCLQTVLEILEEKRDTKYFCPFELHLASLKFLYTFWVGPHLLAIDSLKKTSNVWTLITFPLFDESTFNDILCLYILRILAREVFYIKTLERDKFDSDLENKFKILRESDRLIKLSQHIRHNLSDNKISEDSRLLLNAWKDFVVSVIRFDPFNISDEMKIQLSVDIIDSLLNQLKRSRIDSKVVTTLSDILLMILVNWKTTCIDSEEEWNTKMEELLKSTEELKEILAFNVLHSIQTLVIQYLQLSTKDFNSCDWISYSCQLLNQSLRIIEKQIKSKNSLEIEFKLSVTSLSLLQTLITRNSSRVELWIQILRTNYIIESVTNLLNHLNEKKMALELAIHIMSLLIELSSVETSAETLFLIGFVDNLCISLQNTYSTTSVSILKSKSSLNWINVFHLSIRLIVNLVRHLRHHFVDTAITFVAIHLDHITDVLKKLRTTPKMEEISESILIITLCHSLSLYHQIWRSSHSFSFERIQEEVLKTSNSMIAFLIRPNYLSYVMETPEPSKTVISMDVLTPKKISPKAAIESKTYHKSISWEPESSLHTIKTSVLDSLFTFQAFSIAFLQNISPNVLLLMERQGLGSDWNIILNTSFSSPDVDPNMSLSFGSLINCIHICIKTLNRSEKWSESENSRPSPQISSLLIFIFEMSLSFIISQAIVAQMSATVSDVDKQIIVREIKSELSTVISNVSPRQTKRLSQSSHLSTPRSPSSTSSLIERHFVKFLLQFVDKISNN